MEEEDIYTKQQYLRTEILDKGYDAQDFNDYMCHIRNEENIDLNNWTLQEIKNVVNSFKEMLKSKEAEENENENDKEIDKNIIKESPNINLNNIGGPIIKEKNDNSNMNISNNAFDYYEKTIFCEKLKHNEMTLKDNLYITVTEPVKIKQGFFSISYYQYSVKTFPLNYNVSRKISDFIFLSQKLPLINPAIYIPELPNFQFSLKDDSPEKMSFLQNYMNLLIENKFFRTLPIIHDFLTLPQIDWNNKIKYKYNKIKEPMSFYNMPNLEGKYTIKITNEIERAATRIKNDLNSKIESYKNLDKYLDELLINLDKISICFKNISLCFSELYKKYKNNNEILYKGNEILYNLFQMLSNNFNVQKNFIKEEIKYFFLFISKELNTFLKKYEDYHLARDNYKALFDKLKKMKNPLKEDFELLRSSKKYYAFYLYHVNNEYCNLGKRQGKRLIKQFMKYNDNKNNILQNYEKCNYLFNFQDNFNIKENKEDIIESEVLDNDNINEANNNEIDNNFQIEESKIDINNIKKENNIDDNINIKNKNNNDKDKNEEENENSKNINKINNDTNENNQK